MCDFYPNLRYHKNLKSYDVGASFCNVSHNCIVTEAQLMYDVNKFFLCSFLV
jgi:hypothetical protein